MTRGGQNNEDRAARLAGLRAQQRRAQQRRAQRRRTTLVIASACLVAVALVVAMVVSLVGQRREGALEAAASQPIVGLRDFPDLGREHTTEPVSYPQSPAVGGDHAPVWTNCGVYTTAVDTSATVHFLEHGAVWIAYRPDLAAGQVQALTTRAQSGDYVVLSPGEGLSSPVAASAWGKQLALDSPEDPRLELFLRAYEQGPQTPEPGAPCTGGVGA